MQRVLVTGGAGYIGSHTCKALAAAGWVPVCFDNFEAGHREVVRWGPCVEGDVRSETDLVRAILQYEIEGVIHFAGRIAVGESVANPLVHYATNVGGTMSLLRAMQVTGVRRLVFSSSAAVYGVPNDIPVAEDETIAPISPYGRSKAMAESIIADVAAAHGIRGVALRYFNASGADAACETGEWHEPETHLIPLAIAAAESGQPLTVNGADYPTPDGTCIRDFVHVSDLARAHVAALDALARGQVISAALNVGTGAGHSIRSVLAAVAEVTGRRVNSVIGSRRAGDPAMLVASVDRIRKELDWRPIESSLQHIVATAWNWHQSRMAGGAKA